MILGLIMYWCTKQCQAQRCEESTHVEGNTYQVGSESLAELAVLEERVSFLLQVEF